MKYNVRSAYLEVTRCCNLKCAHCMRGPAQKMTMSKEDVDMFFDKLNCDSIMSLTIGGGEPTLAPDIISYIIDKLIERNIEVGGLAMITNGQKFSREVVDAFNRFDEYEKRRREPWETIDYCSGNVQIGFSKDKYHNPISSKVRNAYEDTCERIVLYDVIVKDDKVKRTGNATFGVPYIYHPNVVYYEVEDEGTVFIDGEFNMSANGFINTNGFGSYVDMDANNFGHIKDFSVRDFLMNFGIRVDTAVEFEIGSDGQRNTIERKLGYLK